MRVLGFNDYVHHLHEGTYPAWVRVSVGAMVLKIRNLAGRIEREKDPAKQNALLAQQSKLHAYLSGLAVAVGSSDRQLTRRLRR
jgi:hypothetical protein